MTCFVVLFFAACNQTKPISKKETDPKLVEAGNQLKLLIESVDNSFNGNFNPETDSGVPFAPRSLMPDKSLKLVPSRDWCSGFFAGCLWEMFELTGDQQWEKPAIRFTEPLEDQKLNGKTHDMGFKMMPTFGKA